jgi:hypothetical protein
MQFDYLFRNKNSLRPKARSFLELVQPENWNVPGCTSTSRIEKELTEAYSVWQQISKRVKLSEALVADVCSGKGFLSLLLRDLGARVVAVDKGFSKMAKRHTEFLKQRDVCLLDLDILSKRDVLDIFELQMQYFFTSGGLIDGLLSDNFSDSSRIRRIELEGLAKGLKERIEACKEQSNKHAVMVAVHPCGVSPLYVWFFLFSHIFFEKASCRACH